MKEIGKWTRSPHAQPVGGRIDTERERHDEFLRLACLNYGRDDPARWSKAAELLAEHPEIAGGSIHAAAAAGDGQGVHDWLAKRPRLASLAGGPFDWEPLLYLCYSRVDAGQRGAGFIKAAIALLDSGGDPNAGYLWNGMTSPFTALTGAFGEGENGPNQPPHQIAMPLATVLLSRGADPNDAQSLYNRTWSRSDEHLELLVSVKPRLGEGDGGPWHRRLGEAHPTPKEMVNEELVKAAAMGRSNRVRLMLQVRADPAAIGTHPMHGGRSAYELAVLNGNMEIAEMLETAGAHAPELAPVEMFVSYCLQHERRSADELLAANPTLLEEALQLHPGLVRHAAELGRQYSVRLLVELGFDANHVDRVTALHEAAWRGDQAMAALLLDLGADPSIEDADHHSTPAGWALHAHHDALADYLRGAEG